MECLGHATPAFWPLFPLSPAAEVVFWIASQNSLLGSCDLLEKILVSQLSLGIAFLLAVLSPRSSVSIMLLGSCDQPNYLIETEEEKFILAHGFRGLSPWFLGPMFLDLC